MLKKQAYFCILNLKKLKEFSGSFFIKNGKISEKEVFDSSFLLKGINVYEVLRQNNGFGVFLDDHLERFRKSASGKNINYDFNNYDFPKAIKMLCDKNHQQEGNIKMVIHSEKNMQAELYIYPVTHSYPTNIQYQEGVDVIIMEETRPDPGLKNWRPDFRERINLLKKNRSVYEILLENQDGHITEGSQSNLFFIKNNRLFTAREEKVLSGITRDYIIRICKRKNIPVYETDFGKKELLESEAVFISGTSPRILPVRSIDNQPFFAGHPLLKILKSEYDKEIKRYLNKKYEE